jgi:hypothetical protein
VLATLAGLLLHPYAPHAVAGPPVLDVEYRLQGALLGVQMHRGGGLRMQDTAEGTAGQSGRALTRHTPACGWAS